MYETYHSNNIVVISTPRNIFIFSISKDTALVLQFKIYIYKKEHAGNMYVMSVKEEAAEYRRLGAILRHCLISRADGEDRTEEFHR